jgi:RNA polymerase sigma-70 factor, ECF subfamily
MRLDIHKLSAGGREEPSQGDVIPLRRSSLGERTDDELMQIASGGVDDAFAELVGRYQEQVRGYCTRCCGGAAAGDDVAQEVFLELWRTRGRYEPRGRFRSYLFTIVHTRMLNAVRRRPREAELPDDIHPASGCELDAVIEAERARRVRQKLGHLPRKLQEALLLRFAGGLDYAEMSEVLGRSESAVRSRVFHGLLRMRELLGKDREP